MSVDLQAIADATERHGAILNWPRGTTFAVTVVGDAVELRTTTSDGSYTAVGLSGDRVCTAPGRVYRLLVDAWEGR